MTPGYVRGGSALERERNWGRPANRPPQLDRYHDRPPSVARWERR